MKKYTLYLLFVLAILSCDDAAISFSNEIDPFAGEELTLLSYQVTQSSGDVEFHSLQDNLEREVLLNDVRKNEFIYDQSRLTSIIQYNTDQTIDESRTYNYDTNGNVLSIDEIGVYTALSGNDMYNREVSLNANILRYQIPQSFFLGEVFRIELTLNSDGLIEQLNQSNSQTGSTEAIYDFIYDSNDNCTRVDITRVSGGNVIQNSYNYIYDNARNPLYTHIRANYIPFVLKYGQAKLSGDDISTVIKNFGKNNILRTDTEYYQYTYNNNNYAATVTMRQTGTNEILSSTVFNYQQ